MRRYIQFPGYKVDKNLVRRIRGITLPYIGKMGARDGFNFFVNKYWEMASHVGIDICYDIIFDLDNKKRILIGSHTREEWEWKKRQYDNRCFYCGKKLKRLTKDHIIAVRNGGANTIDNIVPACMPCNRRKGYKSIAKFKEGANLKLI